MAITFEEEKKINWLGVAAGLLLILAVVGFFFAKSLISQPVISNPEVSSSKMQLKEVVLTDPRLAEMDLFTGIMATTAKIGRDNPFIESDGAKEGDETKDNDTVKSGNSLDNFVGKE